jgi:hypothetical protein
MKDVWKYLLVGLGIFLLVFLIGLFFFTGGGWGQYGMGPWMMGGYDGFGWLMMFGMILLSLLVIGSIIAGIVWLARSMGGPATPLHSQPCPNCGKFVQVGWMACPYCGQKL